MKSFVRRSMVVVAALSSLGACNALLGVEDVSLREGASELDGAAVTDGGALNDGAEPSLEDGDVAPADRAVLSLGFYHTCALMPDGTVRCWGRNAAGQLGDGTALPSDGGTLPDVLKPQSVPGINDAIAIGSGTAHTCIARKLGTVLCWGINLNGPLGDGTVESSSSPVAVLNVQDAVAIAGGGLFTCALLKDKTASCWGENSFGQLGDGTKAPQRLTAAPVKDLANVASVSAGWTHACAVVTNGDVMCWGRNDVGQLGIGSIAESLTPAKLTALSEIVQVAVLNRSTCALQKGGRVYCWGSNDNGQLGNGILSDGAHPSPALVPSIDDATFLWAGYEHVCALRRSGAVVCWGRARSGQLGGGVAQSADAAVATPGAVVGVTTASAIWAGGNRGCALALDGRALCWGDNEYGQIGNGTTATAYAAVPVSDFP